MASSRTLADRQDLFRGAKLVAGSDPGLDQEVLHVAGRAEDREIARRLIREVPVSVRHPAGDQGARAGTAGDLGEAILAVVAEVGQPAAERPEELLSRMGVERRGAAAGGHLYLHDEKVPTGLLVGGVKKYPVLHHVEGSGGAICVVVVVTPPANRGRGRKSKTSRCGAIGGAYRPEGAA